MQRQPLTPNNDTAPFSLQALWADGLSIVRLSGSVGLESGGAFESALLGLVDRLEDTVVLDLAAVDFINVIGLGVIVQLGQRLGERGGRLMLHGTGPRIQRLIQAVRLDELFPDPCPAGRSATRDPAIEPATCA